MISRWCGAPEPEIWRFYNCCHEGFDKPCEHEISQHDRCMAERNKYHDDPCHRECCWGEREIESRDCTCGCHAEVKSDA